MGASDSIDTEDLLSSRLSVTIGFGPTLFRDRHGIDRFGLASRQPEGFATLPRFANDQHVPGISGGDLCLQVCSDDEQVNQHVVRTLLRQAGETAQARWSQSGFRRFGTEETGTPRNLLGFKDGSANIGARDLEAQSDFVWVRSEDGTDWMAGGTYAVTRRVAMRLDAWDDETVPQQEQVIGRVKGSGAPLSGGVESDFPDVDVIGPDGAPAIHPHAHVAVSHPANNDGERILRRGYNFSEGPDSRGRSVAGLFFIAFNRSNSRQFIPMMTRMAAVDRLNSYVRYESASTFAIPPGPATDGFIGDRLLLS